jgi:maleate cis-trans isomerase
VDTGAVVERGLDDVVRNYGYRARIGSISPAAINEIKPYEFYRAAPPGTTLVFAELSVREVTQQEVDEALPLVVGAGREMARMAVDFIVIAGTPMVVMRPPEEESRLIAEVAAAAGGIPVNTAQSMEVAALRHLGMRRIVVATPWGPRINDPLREYLVHHGFDVLAIEGAGVPIAERGRSATRTALDLGASLLDRYPEADGLYIACPNWPTLQAVPILEARFGKPVVNGIVTFIWYPLAQLDRFEPVPGYGRLLAGEP